MQAAPGRADSGPEGGAEMKEAVVLMRFLRHDPVGQRFGVAVLVIAWLAVAWTSVTFAAAVPPPRGSPGRVPGRRSRRPLLGPLRPARADARAVAARAGSRR